jgi:hypothetical protein
MSLNLSQKHMQATTITDKRRSSMQNLLLSHIFSIAVFLLIVSISSGAQSTDKHGLVIEGANSTALTSTDIQTLSNEAKGTGVKWILLSALWTYSEPNAPTASCQPSQGPHCYCGPKAACHNYNFTALDQFVNSFLNTGISVGIRFYKHPIWAGGQTCAGFDDACGVIMSDHMTTFQNNLYDFAYNLAKRYAGKIAFWIIWNEPNLANEFSPQDSNLGGGYLTGEYIDLIQTPAHSALLIVIPSALTVGPELYTPNGGGQIETCDYWHEVTGDNSPAHCMWLYGTGEWEDAMLRYFSNNFPIFTIHNYSDTNSGSGTAVADLWNNVMVPLGKQRQIWLTEFNFTGGTCSLTEQTIVDYTASLYNSMSNQRAFYFALPDGAGACGNGLVHGKAYNWAEKTILYPGFVQIVTGK